MLDQARHNNILLENFVKVNFSFFFKSLKSLNNTPKRLVFSGWDLGSQLINDDRRSDERRSISHNVGFHWRHAEVRSTPAAINYLTIA